MYILLKYFFFRHEADVNYDIIQTHNGFQIYRNSFAQYIRLYHTIRQLSSPPRPTAACYGKAAARRLTSRGARVRFNPNIAAADRASIYVYVYVRVCRI